MGNGDISSGRNVCYRLIPYMTSLRNCYYISTICLSRNSFTRIVGGVNCLFTLFRWPYRNVQQHLKPSHGFQFYGDMYQYDVYRSWFLWSVNPSGSYGLEVNELQVFLLANLHQYWSTKTLTSFSKFMLMTMLTCSSMVLIDWILILFCHTVWKEIQYQ